MKAAGEKLSRRFQVMEAQCSVTDLPSEEQPGTPIPLRSLPSHNLLA
jgi:hypothetical protein